MTAVACVKVYVGDENRFGDPHQLADLVGKVACAFLETTWTWPRRFGLVAPYAFVLADPQVTQLDARELQTLARDLQRKLFGETGRGEVGLILFEGDHTEIMRFAGVSQEELAALVAGQADARFAGRICKITAEDIRALSSERNSVQPAPSAGAAFRAAAATPGDLAFRGVFHTERELFVGNVAVWREPEASRLPLDAELPDAERPEFDVPILRAAAAVLDSLPVGLLFLPLSYSTLARSSGRAALTPQLEALTAARRGQLAAAIYGTPRAPAFGLLSQIRSWLSPHFGRIDLRVSDPAFEVDSLPAALVSSVTLVLPHATEAKRMAALGQFLQEDSDYRRHGVLQGVGDVRSLRELQACLAHKAPFITGPAVSELMPTPISSVSVPTGRLPYGHDAQAASAA